MVMGLVLNYYRCFPGDPNAPQIMLSYILESLNCHYHYDRNFAW